MATVRPLISADKDAWTRLWRGYVAFYQADVSDAATAHTWDRLKDADGPVVGLVAEDADGVVVGFVNCILHASTWTAQPVCYLQDLFVDEQARGHGAGRALIDAVAARAKAEDWYRVYWLTQSDNATARALYDKIAPATGWVRYDYPL